MAEIDDFWWDIYVSQLSQFLSEFYSLVYDDMQDDLNQDHDDRHGLVIPTCKKLLIDYLLI